MDEQLITDIKVSLAASLVDALFFGLVVCLVFGLVGGLVTQIIAYTSGNPLFSAVGFWIQLGLLIIIGIIGLIIYNRLKYL